MDPRDEWIRELERRQDNIDPIRRIPNGALFQGSLINGNLRLNGVQRAGAIFFGLCGLVTGVFIAVTALVDLRAGRLPEIGLTIFCPLSLWFGWKIIKNAVVNDPERSTHNKH